MRELTRYCPSFIERFVTAVFSVHTHVYMRVPLPEAQTYIHAYAPMANNDELDVSLSNITFVSRRVRVK